MNDLQARAAKLQKQGRRAEIAQDIQGLGALAVQKAKSDPNRVITIEGDRLITRGEMLDAALRLGGALLSRGIKAGDAVAFQLPNWWEACVINLTAALFGFPIVPLLPIYREAELGTMLSACGARAIFVPGTFKKVDYPALVSRAARQPIEVFTVRHDTESERDFATLVTHTPAKPVLPSRDDIKLLLFTSGSTGHPKGVLHSHATIQVMSRDVSRFWSLGSSDVLLVASPIAHIGGSIYAFDIPWMADCAAMLTESWDPAATVRLIDDNNITFMAGATPFLEGLIAAAQAAATNLPSLRRFICGGASVPPELVRAGLAQFPNAVVSRAYGSTEVPCICPGVRTREDAQLRPDCDGECTYEVRIVSEDGRTLPHGEIGEISVRAPQMLVGYLDPADDEDAFDDEGLFRMGDLGRIREGRFIEITGRKKDIIIRKGENISPLEIESVLVRHDDVRQASVVGIPDKERGEMVVAFVVPVERRDFTFADMTRHLETIGLARQKFPERLHAVQALPVNSVGKVQKNELRVLAAELAATDRAH